MKPTFSESSEVYRDMRCARTMLLLALVTWGCSSAKGDDPPKGKAPEARPVPVNAATAQRLDVPIYLEGLGTVTAFKTVNVTPLVDGRLDKVLFREGQEVKKGEVLAQIDPRPYIAQLHQAQGALTRDTAMLKQTKLDLDRYTTLASQKLIAQQQVDDQLGTVGQYQGGIEVDQAQIDSANLNIEYSRIISPIDGVTGVRLIDEGNVVHAATSPALVVVTQLTPIAVLFTLPQDDLHHVLTQLRGGPLRVDAFSRDGSEHLDTGEMSIVDNQINQNTATARFKAIFPNTLHLLWPNAFVKARLLLETFQNALTIPVTAVQRGPSGTFVYVIGKDNTVSVRPVEIEKVAGEQALLKSGVQPGEQVVTDGQNLIKPGSKVVIRDAAGARAGADGAQQDQERSRTPSMDTDHAPPSGRPPGAPGGVHGNPAFGAGVGGFTGPGGHGGAVPGAPAPAAGAGKPGGHRPGARP